MCVNEVNKNKMNVTKARILTLKIKYRKMKNTLKVKEHVIHKDSIEKRIERKGRKNQNREINSMKDIFC